MTKHEALARANFLEGYNCAQAVLLAFAEDAGLEKDTALRLASSFGGGVGGMREMCGALSGAFMLAGVKGSAGIEAPGTTKAQTYQQTREMANAFKEKNGTYLCCELKGVADGNVRRSCPGCIEDACALVEKMLGL